MLVELLTAATVEPAAGGAAARLVAALQRPRAWLLAAGLLPCHGLGPGALHHGAARQEQRGPALFLLFDAPPHSLLFSLVWFALM